MWRSIGKVNEHSNFQHQSWAACQRWSELTKCAITTQVTNDYNPIYLRPLRLFSQYTVVELTTKVSLIFKIVEIWKLLIFDHCAMGTVLMSCVMILAGMLIKNVGTNGCHSIISETMRIEKQRISPSFKIHGLMNSWEKGEQSRKAVKKLICLRCS